MKYVSLGGRIEEKIEANARNEDLIKTLNSIKVIGSIASISLMKYRLDV